MIYGIIFIMEMICEFECEDGKFFCLVNICICVCLEVDDVLLLEILEFLDDWLWVVWCYYENSFEDFCIWYYKNKIIEKIKLVLFYLYIFLWEN